MYTKAAAIKTKQVVFPWELKTRKKHRVYKKIQTIENDLSLEFEQPSTKEDVIM